MFCHSALINLNTSRSRKQWPSFLNAPFKSYFPAISLCQNDLFSFKFQWNLFPCVQWATREHWRRTDNMPLSEPATTRLADTFMCHTTIMWQPYDNCCMTILFPVHTYILPADERTSLACQRIGVSKMPWGRNCNPTFRKGYNEST